jgi:D-xylose 1-dehydrogenase (NADP+, D-xylono-1,5-lactone-forming)
VTVLRLALLSTAQINDAIIDGAAGSELVSIVGAGSRDPARAATYAAEHAFERWWGSYDALFADPEVDAVYVALPNVLHVEWSIRALEAGKHVLCEKPMGRDPRAVARAFDAAERAGLVLMEAFMYRHHPQIKRARELLDEGVVGQLRLVRAGFCSTLAKPDDVRWAPELGGGALLDVGCYCVSGLRLVAGEPETVFGEQTLAPSGVDVRFAGTLRFPGGVLGSFSCGIDTAPSQGLEAVGSEGSLHVSHPFTADLEAVELRRGTTFEETEVELIEIEHANRYQLQLENFARAVAGEEPPLLGRGDAVAQARVLDALARSAETGAPASLQ